MAASTTSSTTLPVLHIWPRTDSLLSLDPACVSALLYLQLAIPDKFSVDFCNNPDLSPSGQLPYLTHGMHSVAGFEAIVKLVNHLPDCGKHLDDALSPAEKAQNVARVAHVESALGDLVAHVYYSLSANWTRQTRHTLASIFPIPQSYYVPERIRQSYKPRLEAAGLWTLVGIEQEEEEEKQRFSFRRPLKKSKKAHEKVKFKENAQRTKVIERARAVFDMYAKLLQNASYFYDVGHPTILDVVFAAHIHMLRAPQPDSLITNLLSESYPSLLAHCDRVLHAAFPPSSSFPPTVAPSRSFSFRSIFPPDIRSIRSHHIKSPALTEQEKRFKWMRWTFFGTAGLVLGAYIFGSGIVSMWVEGVRVTRRLLEEAEEAEEDGEEDEEEDYEEDGSEDAEDEEGEEEEPESEL